MQTAIPQNSNDTSNRRYGTLKTIKTLIYLKNSGILLDYAGDSPSFFAQRWQRGAAVTILAFGHTSDT
ncbi:MAG: hypothetical protein PHD01_08085 [Geobacteraceae bacterium]|nr:hypothetical protein [Geobacteraceae bacterium]